MVVSRESAGEAPSTSKMRATLQVRMHVVFITISSSPDAHFTIPGKEQARYQTKPSRALLATGCCSTRARTSDACSRGSRQLQDLTLATRTSPIAVGNGEVDCVETDAGSLELVLAPGRGD